MPLCSVQVLLILLSAGLSVSWDCPCARLHLASVCRLSRRCSASATKCTTLPATFRPGPSRCRPPLGWVPFDPSESFAPCQRRDATTPATTRRPSSCKLRRGELQSKRPVKRGRRDPPLCQKVKDRCLLSERLSDVAEWAASDRGELHGSAQELPRQCCCRQPGEFGMPED